MFSGRDPLEEAVNLRDSVERHCQGDCLLGCLSVNSGNQLPNWSTSSVFLGFDPLLSPLGMVWMCGGELLPVWDIQLCRQVWRHTNLRQLLVVPVWVPGDWASMGQSCVASLRWQ